MSVTAPDLLGDLPPFEQNSRIIQGTLAVIANELARIETARLDLIAQYFPSTADSLLHFFEDLVGLPVDPTYLTLAARRQAVEAYMLRLKSSGSGDDWRAIISALLGNAWTFQNHDPAVPGSPAAYTIRVLFPFSPGAPVPAGVAAAAHGAGILSGTEHYTVTTTTLSGETTPATPVSVTVAANSSVEVTWNTQPSPPATGFNIYRGPSSDPTTMGLIGSVASPGTSFIDDGSVAPGGPPPLLDTSASVRPAVVSALLRTITPAHIALEVDQTSGFVLGGEYYGGGYLGESPAGGHG